MSEAIGGQDSSQPPLEQPNAQSVSRPQPQPQPFALVYGPQEVPFFGTPDWHLYQAMVARYPRPPPLPPRPPGRPPSLPPPPHPPPFPPPLPPGYLNANAIGYYVLRAGFTYEEAPEAVRIIWLESKGEPSKLQNDRGPGTGLFQIDLWAHWDNTPKGSGMRLWLEKRGVLEKIDAVSFLRDPLHNCQAARRIFLDRQLRRDSPTGWEAWSTYNGGFKPRDRSWTDWRYATRLIEDFIRNRPPKCAVAVSDPWVWHTACSEPSETHSSFAAMRSAEATPPLGAFAVLDQGNVPQATEEGPTTLFGAWPSRFQSSTTTHSFDGVEQDPDFSPPPSPPPPRSLSRQQFEATIPEGPWSTSSRTREVRWPATALSMFRPEIREWKIATNNRLANLYTKLYLYGCLNMGGAYERCKHKTLDDQLLLGTSSHPPPSPPDIAIRELKWEVEWACLVVWSATDLKDRYRSCRELAQSLKISQASPVPVGEERIGLIARTAFYGITQETRRRLSQIRWTPPFDPTTDGLVVGVVLHGSSGKRDSALEPQALEASSRLSEFLVTLQSNSVRPTVAPRVLGEQVGLLAKVSDPVDLARRLATAFEQPNVTQELFGNLRLVDTGLVMAAGAGGPSVVAASVTGAGEKGDEGVEGDGWAWPTILALVMGCLLFMGVGFICICYLLNRQNRQNRQNRHDQTTARPPTTYAPRDAYRQLRPSEMPPLLFPPTL